MRDDGYSIPKDADILDNLRLTEHQTGEDFLTGKLDTTKTNPLHWKINFDSMGAGSRIYQFKNYPKLQELEFDENQQRAMWDVTIQDLDFL